MGRKSEQPDFRHPEMGEMTAEQYAKWLEEHDGEGIWGEQIEAEVSPGLGSVVSVRFNRGELDLINAAAEDAGLKLSTFIRQVVMSQVKLPGTGLTVALALIKDREAITAAAETLSSVVRHLQAVPDETRSKAA